ncbi:carboxymuconolactone decarboxylase family protein [Cupriavidus necator]|uniref:Putative carboxymuconolactone decarboxylase n=1 Tax=Cupriavidus necator (strain ATCC 17699 / DSM 428 / KCTC 22496 / NCIMB 10442 / H16 / Stanier 337) TaxID=381666 RepID=Q0KE86_CUPNH|nr:putative carboxymuconolactone decarboxylase [Cupriavidus necator H16]
MTWGRGTDAAASRIGLIGSATMRHPPRPETHAMAEPSLQQLVTEFAWGTVWTRDGLDRKQRSLVSMLIALNRPQELAGHLRGALANGVTPQELRELMVHSAIYCGFPAALDASRKLTEVLDAANG